MRSAVRFFRGHILVALLATIRGAAAVDAEERPSIAVYAAYDDSFAKSLKNVLMN